MYQLEIWVRVELGLGSVKNLGSGLFKILEMGLESVKCGSGSFVEGLDAVLGGSRHRPGWVRFRRPDQFIQVRFRWGPNLNLIGFTSVKPFRILLRGRSRTIEIVTRTMTLD